MYSRTTLIGRLGKDPELSTTGDTPRLSLNVATSEYYKGRDDQYKETTTWHRVQVWGKLATILADKLQKGDLVLVDGTYRTNKANGRDGVERTYYTIRADEVKRLNKRTAPSNETPPPDNTVSNAPQGAGDDPFGDDDIEIPF